MTLGSPNDYQELQPSSNIIDELIKHIEKELPSFVSSNTFDKIMVKKKNETQHSTAFSVFMMKHQEKFTFMNEVAQKGNSKIDVAIYDRGTDEIIFTIEAKLLPTPKGSKKKPRSASEYVFSKKGEGGAAIQRFRKGVHGVDTNENPLAINGIIAYIKDKDFEHWHTQINQWVIDATWSEAEKLKKDYFNTIAKLNSFHKREDDSEVRLHHFWVYVKP